MLPRVPVQCLWGGRGRGSSKSLAKPAREPEQCEREKITGEEATLEPAGLLCPALVCRAVVKCDKFGSPALYYHCCLSGLVKKATAVHNRQRD